MSNYRNLKQKYDRLKIEYDIIKRGNSKKGGKASELFDSLKDHYIDKLERIDDQRHILSKQTNILNEKDKKIDSNKDLLKSNISKIHTNKRIASYNESDDRYSKSFITILKALLGIISIILIIIIAKIVKNR